MVKLSTSHQSEDGGNINTQQITMFYGTEAEIQGFQIPALFPNPIWLVRGRASRHQKLAPTFPWIDNSLMVTKLLKVGCLPYAVGKQPSIPLIDLGRTWTLNWWWWWCHWIKVGYKWFAHKIVPLLWIPWYPWLREVDDITRHRPGRPPWHFRESNICIFECLRANIRLKRFL